jgi:hypothetical protein
MLRCHIELKIVIDNIMKIAHYHLIPTLLWL